MQELIIAAAGLCAMRLDRMNTGFFQGVGEMCARTSGESSDRLRKAGYFLTKLTGTFVTGLLTSSPGGELRSPARA